MQIIVTDPKDTDIHLRFPTGLLLNPLTAALVPRFLRKYGVPLTFRQLNGFIRALQDYRKRHPDWTLVEVKSADGEYVLIRL